MDLDRSLTAEKIYQFYKNRPSKPRHYLGWSEVGHECDRYLWYSFRRAFKPDFPGRILRLFETGFREEDRVLQNLRDIGCDVKCDDGNGGQIGVVSKNRHLRGHVDAVVLGLPEAPKTWHLVDVKTINKNNFNKLKKQEMRELFPKYYAQAQGYMGELGLKRAMYVFVHKDTDEIYTERFNYSKKEFEFYRDRAIDIIDSNEPCAPCTDRPETWWKCKFCDARPICLGEPMLINCRTCRNIKPMNTGEWFCSHHEASVPNEDQSYHHKCYRGI